MKKWIPQFIVGYFRWLRIRRRYPTADIWQDTVIGGKCWFGRSARVYPRAEIVDSSVGDFSYVGHGAKLTHAEIGRFCSLAPEVIIGGFMHPVGGHVSTSPVFFSLVAQCGTSFVTRRKFVEVERTTVGSDVWAGYRAIVLPGVTIGDGAIIGAGAVVTADVAPYDIVAGVPARHVRYRFDPGLRERLLASRWWERDAEWIRANAELFESPDELLAALEGRGE